MTTKLSRPHALLHDLTMLSRRTPSRSGFLEGAATLLAHGLDAPVLRIDLLNRGRKSSASSCAMANRSAWGDDLRDLGVELAAAGEVRAIADVQADEHLAGRVPDECTSFIVVPLREPRTNIPLGGLLVADERPRPELVLEAGEEGVLPLLSHNLALELHHRATEERFELAMQAARDGLFDWDLLTNTVYYSPGWKRMLGYEDQEIPNDFAVWEKLTAPEDVDRSWGMLRELIDGQRERFEIELRMRHKAGHWIDVLSRAQLVFDAGADTPRRLIGTHVDITARKEAERLRAKADATYRDLLQSLDAGVVVHAPDTSIRLANPAACRLLGLSEAQLLGKEAMDPDWRFLREDGSDLPLAEYPVQQVLAGGRALRNQVAGVRHGAGDESQVRWLLVNGFASVGGDGEVEEVVINFVDISERTRLEEEQQLLREQLNQAQKMEAVGRLAGGVAHDFNNMLCAIGVNVDLALDDLDPTAPLRGELRGIKDAADRAADLTRQLLAFSRKQVMDPRVIDLSHLLRNLHSMLLRLLGEDVVLETHPQGRGRVRVDPSQIEQVVVNLAVNARDAMPDGGQLRIETSDVVLGDDHELLRRGLSAGAYVKLAVSDSGCGMSEEVREKIFEPFFTTKELGQGTGLGLATVFGIVQQHEAHIEVESEEGQGTRFEIYLPQVEDAVERRARPSSARPSGRGERILVVEDEEMVRRLAERLLERLGYEVLVAASGEQALSLAEEHQGSIALLLTDVVMPHMNGRQLAEELGARFPEIKVLFTSGYAENTIAHHGVLEEGVHFIAKPYSPNELAVRLREVLEG